MELYNSCRRLKLTKKCFSLKAYGGISSSMAYDKDIVIEDVEDFPNFRNCNPVKYSLFHGKSLFNVNSDLGFCRIMLTCK